MPSLPPRSGHTATKQHIRTRVAGFLSATLAGLLHCAGSHATAYDLMYEDFDLVGFERTIAERAKNVATSGVTLGTMESVSSCAFFNTKDLWIEFKIITSCGRSRHEGELRAYFD